jgi:tRNA pseudouridine55 synthase
LLVDKPAGCTSHDVVARVRRIRRTRAVGHTGTLDPFATGLLVLLFGSATRLARFVEAQPKTYRAVARLGRQTTTDDLTGDPVETEGEGPASEARPRVPPDRRAVAAGLEEFRGPQRQRPPAFSAKQVRGERSYRRARRGETVELPEVAVGVHEIELLDYAYPDVTFRCVVSPGTYVRALARDLGARLGVGAHLVALRREAIGDLRVEDAVPLAEVRADTVLLPPLAVLGPMPRLELSEAEERAVGFGQPLRRSAALAAPLVALVARGRLVGVGESRAGQVAPTVVLAANR